MENKIGKFIFAILILFLLKIGVDKSSNNFESNYQKDAPKRFTASTPKVSQR